MKTELPPQNANRLLDLLMVSFNVKNDAELSRQLDVAPPVISKVRHGKLPVGPSLQIRIMRVFGLTLGEIDEALL
jgi:plasmid maintenance system antidote protein VapI